METINHISEWIMYGSLGSIFLYTIVYLLWANSIGISYPVEKKDYLIAFGLVILGPFGLVIGLAVSVCLAIAEIIE